MTGYWRELSRQMVDSQLIFRGVSDKSVLAAFGNVPRHRFIPEGLDKINPYGDYPLSIGEGQTISQPYMAALMTESLQLKGGEKVLEIGTGSGYQAAVLAELTEKVYTIERIASLAKRAEQTLSELGYANIKIKTDDGSLGWKEFSPYDAIVVTAGAPSIPPCLVEQLAGKGRLVLPVGNAFNQMLTLLTRDNDQVIKSDICSCVFVPLIGKEGWKK
ncbi:MAG: protein-L-isoaspartate(D-aspartate) O-methyltransferase [Candidatus Omnitrophota bacterium]|nr:protein-L-isoaspartate(D-aspartate) O-methyltransferase [Candidatus Omnitrophota bacterium]